MIVDFNSKTSRNLVATADWDKIDPDGLSPCGGARSMSTEFGYLLRHYWTIPEDLIYRTEIWRRTSNGKDSVSSQTVKRSLLRCDADVCVWRESILDTKSENALITSDNSTDSGTLCEYDRSKQTFRTKPIPSIDFEAKSEESLKKQAISQLPILVPLLPIPVGFTWHVKNDGGFMDFTLESVTKKDGATILFIRRKGRYLSHKTTKHGDDHSQRFFVEREGLTAYDWGSSLVLEDRVYDRIHTEDGSTDIVDTDILTTRRLTFRHQTNARPESVPLFLKYRTKNGKNYLYDCGTGRIIEVDEVIYAIVDDFHGLSYNEIRVKYRHLGEDRVWLAYQELEGLQRDGYLVDHAPAELSKVELVEYDNHVHFLDDFWKRTAMLLILGITERCNLNCSYCCFSGNFAGQRTHNNRSVPWEIAEKAITYYLENDQAGDGTCPITFYGGEPLLEFHLLQECVRYAEKLARKLGKTLKFAISTNGTLLDDIVCDYLVEKNFLVMVSLDGPQTSHDRYRVFPNGKGSFDIVDKNLRRFAERYPDYKYRGLNVTLAPPLDLEATGRFIEELYPDYPLTRASIVNTGTEYRFRENEASATRYGCSSCNCKKNAVGDIERFRDFGESDHATLKTMWESCMKSIANVGVVESYKKMPFAMLLFEGQITPYHRRLITPQAPSMIFYVPCLPGFTRRFVDVDGNYRVCERVDDSEAYKLGNVWDGPDAAKLERTMEQRRHFGDCANCQALRTCDLCYARIPNVDSPETGYDPMFDLQCQRTRQAAKHQLKTYTEIMEANPKAFDRPIPPDFLEFKKLRFGARENSVPASPDPKTV